MEYPPESLMPDNWFASHQPSRCEAIFLGNKGTYGPVHSDFPLGIGWIYVASGLKRVILFPPEKGEQLSQTFGWTLSDTVFKTSGFAETLSSDVAAKIVACGGQTAHLQPGELLIIPTNWWHQITNLRDDTLSRHNMVLPCSDIQILCDKSDPQFTLDLLLEAVPFRLAQLNAQKPDTPSELVQGLMNYQQALQDLLGSSFACTLDQAVLDSAQALLHSLTSSLQQHHSHSHKQQL
jgi:hypothetical protein